MRELSVAALGWLDGNPSAKHWSESLKSLFAVVISQGHHCFCILVRSLSSEWDVCYSTSLLLPFHIVVVLNVTRETELWPEEQYFSSRLPVSMLKFKSRADPGHGSWPHLPSTAIKQQQASQLCLWLSAVLNYFALFAFYLYRSKGESKVPGEKTCFSQEQHEKYFVSPGVLFKLWCFLGLSYNRKTEVSVVKLCPRLSLSGISNWVR